MTLNEISKYLHRLAINDYFNRHKFSYDWLKTYLSTMVTEVGKPFIFEIALPDGWWYMSVTRISENCYGYFIPETRAQETELKKRLFGVITREE